MTGRSPGSTNGPDLSARPQALGALLCAIFPATSIIRRRRAFPERLAWRALKSLAAERPRRASITAALG